ncbi:MAG: Lrp/AsnC family transcriptional regulator [Burkholderiaceae bacterium]
MDRIDARILALLQQDGRASAADIGEQIGLSVSATHRRIKLMEDSGVIERYAAVLNRRALGYTTDFYVEIALQSQSEETLDAFEAAVGRSPDILECHLLTGGFDYLLRISTSGPEDYERLHRQVLATLPGVMRMQSSLVLRTVRPWRGYRVAPDA